MQRLKNQSALCRLFFVFLLWVFETVSVHGLRRPSTNDLWDVSQGTEVVSLSPVDIVDGVPGYEGVDLFGANRSRYAPEVGRVVFADEKPKGFVHYVEWRTTRPVQFNRVSVFAGCEPSGARGVSRFVLKTKSPNSKTFDRTLYAKDLSLPYQYLSDQFEVIDAIIVPTEARDFRAEFTDSGIGFPLDSGPRLMELDAFFDPNAGLESATLPDSSVSFDLWDISEGTIVRGNSPLNIGFGTPNPYDARNLFGGDFGDFRLDPENLAFADGKPEGTVHFVEWQTRAPIVLQGFNLFEGAEPSGQRSFKKFSLLAKSLTTGLFDQVVFTREFSPPFADLNSNGLLVSATFKGVLAQEFRAEFIDSGILSPFSAPRVQELDGFGISYAPDLLVLRAVEVQVPTLLGVRYQMQSRLKANDSEWVNRFEPFSGTGTNHIFFDSIHGNSSKFYRAIILDQ